MSVRRARTPSQVIGSNDEVTEIPKDPSPDHKPKVIACIPAYNDEKNIASVIIKVRDYTDKIYVCDDGSSDETSKIAQALGAEVIIHPSNMGYALSLVDLFNLAIKAEADYVVTVDAFGKKYAHEIPKLIKILAEQGADIVTTAQDLQAPSGTPTNNNATKSVNANPVSNPTETIRGFRAYSRKALLTLPLTEIAVANRGQIEFNAEILKKAAEKGLVITVIPIKIEDTTETLSNKQPKQILNKLLEPLRITSINHPLALYGIPGIIAILGSIILDAYTYLTFIHGYLSSNAMILGIGSLTVGLILIVTAIILWVVKTTSGIYQ